MSEVAPSQLKVKLKLITMKTRSNNWENSSGESTISGLATHAYFIQEIDPRVLDDPLHPILSQRSLEATLTNL